MRYELNFDEDKVNDVLVVGGASYDLKGCCELLNEQQATINKQEEIIKSQDMEISRQYNLCLAMSGVLREEFGVYDVFDRTKDKKY